MIARAGDVRRLRPHVKTHKTTEVTKMMLAKGITKVKAATLVEAEMCAAAGMPEVLLSFPQVGPNVARLLKLSQAFPNTKITTLSDDEGHILHLSTAFAQAGRKIEVWLDVDVGQHRSGIEPGDEAFELYKLIHNSPGTTAGGLHIYDGQVRELDLQARIKHGEESFGPRRRSSSRSQRPACRCNRPPAAARRRSRFMRSTSIATYSPGTCVFWDDSYASKFQDLEFEYALLLMGRVVSKPGGNRLCIDLGYKSVSPDNAGPRGIARPARREVARPMGRASDGRNAGGREPSRRRPGLCRAVPRLPDRRAASRGRTSSATAASTAPGKSSPAIASCSANDRSSTSARALGDRPI